jgi:hypothetical protein
MTINTMLADLDSEDGGGGFGAVRTHANFWPVDAIPHVLPLLFALLPVAGYHSVLPVLHQCYSSIAPVSHQRCTNICVFVFFSSSHFRCGSTISSRC